MSIDVSGIRFCQVSAGLFKGFFQFITEVLAHFPSHFFHEPGHALRIVLVQIAEVAGVRQRFEAGFFRFGRGEAGHEPFDVRAPTVLTRDRWRMADAQYEVAASFTAVAAAIFVDRHGQFGISAGEGRSASTRAESRSALTARASVSAKTSPAPTFLNALAHSLMVVPVVHTSSISNTRLPATSCGCCTWNARRRFLSRADRRSLVCASVARTRTRFVKDRGMRSRRLTRSARSNDWLNSRSRNRVGWSGTGMTKSKASVSGRARISNSASASTSVTLPPYLNRRIASWSGGT